MFLAMRKPLFHFSLTAIVSTSLVGSTGYTSSGLSGPKLSLESWADIFYLAHWGQHFYLAHWEHQIDWLIGSTGMIHQAAHEEHK